MAQLPARAQDVVAFWRQAGPQKWFAKDAQFDAQFRDQFLSDHMAAARREYDDWVNHPQGALALMILLDQFPRNAFRDTGHMFATDGLARHYARQALALGHLVAIEASLRVFLVLPFEHSENMADQELAMTLVPYLPEQTREFVALHHKIIAR